MNNSRRGRGERRRNSEGEGDGEREREREKGLKDMAVVAEMASHYTRAGLRKKCLGGV
jgi:hypothetical protein